MRSACSFVTRRATASVSVSVSAMCFSSQAFASTKLFNKISYEWVELDEAAKTATVGLANCALEDLLLNVCADQLAITYVDFPSIGTKVEQDGVICSVESVKAVVDFKSPITGTLAENNSVYEDAANLAKLKNGGAETAEGWIFKFSDVTYNKADLMTSEEFEKFTSRRKKESNT